MKGHALWTVMRREVRRLASRRIYLFMILLAPACCFLFFADLLKQGLPTDLPIAVVDEDNSSMSRQLVRSLDAIPQTDVALRTPRFAEAREALQQARVYGIFHIPAGFKADVSLGKRPVLSFYTNDTYLLPGSLAYKDMRLQAALMNGAVQQTLLLARGEGDARLQARLVPVSLETNPLHNPWISYAIYLANILMPAFVFLFAMFTAAFSLSDEEKRGTARAWLAASGDSVGTALLGKLLPQTLAFAATGLLYLSVLYGYQRFPMNGGFGPMFLAMLLLVLSAQGFAVFVSGITSQSRIVFSACALWGVLSFSISGFTYPAPSMPPLMYWGSNLFPMRHYYLLYVDQALNGIPMAYSRLPYASLALFALLPFCVARRIKKRILNQSPAV